MLSEFDLLYANKPVWIEHKQTKSLCGWALFKQEVADMYVFDTFGGRQLYLKESGYGEYWTAYWDRPKGDKNGF